MKTQKHFCNDFREVITLLVRKRCCYEKALLLEHIVLVYLEDVLIVNNMFLNVIVNNMFLNLVQTVSINENDNILPTGGEKSRLKTCSVLKNSRKQTPRFIF